jgi:hypothetical protein
MLLAAGVSPANTNSSTSASVSVELMFIAVTSGLVHKFQTNSLVSAMFCIVSLNPALENPSVGGSSLNILKQEYGAKFSTPLVDTVDIHPMGLGPIIALNGLCARL